jgi:hypothetical protein
MNIFNNRWNGGVSFGDSQKLKNRRNDGVSLGKLDPIGLLTKKFIVTERKSFLTKDRVKKLIPLGMSSSLSSMFAE